MYIHNQSINEIMFATNTTANVTRRASSVSYQKTSDKKFCGVCHKKGLPESVYTSHFTKSVPGDKGIVTCPTILNAHCTYCKGNGHWADEKFCSLMRRDAKSMRHEKNRLSKSAVPSNWCDALATPSPRVPTDADFPTIAFHPATPVTLPTAGVSWASMASRPPVVLNTSDSNSSNEFVNLAERSKLSKTNGGSVYYNNDSSGELTLAEREAFKILEERLAEAIANPSWFDADDSYDDELDNYYDRHAVYSPDSYIDDSITDSWY